jgi:hypothetical protein
MREIPSPTPSRKGMIAAKREIKPSVISEEWKNCSTCFDFVKRKRLRRSLKKDVLHKKSAPYTYTATTRRINLEHIIRFSGWLEGILSGR